MVMTRNQDQGGLYVWGGGKWVILILLALVAYQIYSGVALKKIDVPGLFEISFADKPNTVLDEQPEITRDFFIGRWQVVQDYGSVSGGSIIDYQGDGRFIGKITQFEGSNGQKQVTKGRWDFEKLSKENFRLQLVFDNQLTWLGNFKMIDQDHIHNIDQNYIAVRMK